MILDLLVLLMLALCMQLESGDIAKVTSREKQAFLKLLKTLPTRGEFFTEEGVARAAPFLHVILAMEKKDLPDGDYYALLALSRGLHDAKKEHREFAARNYAKIPDTTVKLCWGLVLFQYSKEVTPEIVRDLRESLNDRARLAIVRSLTGPDFEAVRKQILAKPAKPK
jgi:hypothetical protein